MLPKEINRVEFFQSKYDYYKTFSFWVVVFACLSSTTFFVSDCQLFGRFAIETLLPRTIILAPMLLYLFIQRRVKSYQLMVPITYLIFHLIMWNTIWAIYYLPDKSHASEGFIIMHLMFFAMGFCAPFHYSTVAHALVIVNILLSNLFNHYANLEIMLSLGIPCVLAICASHYFMQSLYVSHYQTAQKLEYISYYDLLTGVYNRNILSSLIDPDTGGFKASLGKNICVIIFDIDYFKQVNDTYGHVKGDVVLKKLVEVIRSLLGERDCMIRWGGEEFIVIFTDKEVGEIRRLAEELRRNVEASDNGVCPVTISVGIAAYDGETFKTTVDAADHALYRAKEKGRNRVEV